MRTAPDSLCLYITEAFPAHTKSELVAKRNHDYFFPKAKLENVSAGNLRHGCHDRHDTRELSFDQSFTITKKATNRSGLQTVQKSAYLRNMGTRFADFEIIVLNLATQTNSKSPWRLLLHPPVGRPNSTRPRFHARRQRRRYTESLLSFQRHKSYCPVSKFNHR